jgi:hypothetical protein
MAGEHRLDLIRAAITKLSYHVHLHPGELDRSAAMSFWKRFFGKPKTETLDRDPDDRARFADSLMQIKGWGGLTLDLLLAPFDTYDHAFQGAHELYKAFCSTSTDRGVVVICGWLNHLQGELPVAGIVCPALDSDQNKRLLLATPMVGLRRAVGLVKVSDQSMGQLGLPSSPLSVCSYTGHVVVATFG